MDAALHRWQGNRWHNYDLPPGARSKTRSSPRQEPNGRTEKATLAALQRNNFANVLDRIAQDYFTHSSMVCSLLQLRYHRLYFRKCSGISLRQIRGDLIAHLEDVTQQVAECRIFGATRNTLSLIKKLPGVLTSLAVVFLRGLQVCHGGCVAKLRQLFAQMTGFQLLCRRRQFPP